MKGAEPSIPHQVKHSADYFADFYDIIMIKRLASAGREISKLHTIFAGYRVHGMLQDSMKSVNFSSNYYNYSSNEEYLNLLGYLQREQLGHGREDCIREICNHVATQITEENASVISTLIFNNLTYRFWILVSPSKEPFCNVSGSLLDKLLHNYDGDNQLLLCLVLQISDKSCL